MTFLSKSALVLSGAVLLLAASLHINQARAGDCPAVLQHSFNSLQTGQPQHLCQYKGEVVLVVNTASYCGYTDQWKSSGRCWTPARRWSGRPDPGSDP